MCGKTLSKTVEKLWNSMESSSTFFYDAETARACSNKTSGNRNNLILTIKCWKHTHVFTYSLVCRRRRRRHHHRRCSFYSTDFRNHWLCVHEVFSLFGFSFYILGCVIRMALLFSQEWVSESRLCATESNFQNILRIDWKHIKKHTQIENRD